MQINRLSSEQRLQAKIKAREKWHTHFVWFPTRINQLKIVWLEKVFRKGKYELDYDSSVYWNWEYKEYNSVEALKLD